MTSTRKIVGNYYYYLAQRLGDGASAEVYPGFNQKTNKPVAIKIVNKATNTLISGSKLAEIEVKMLQKLKGAPHILQLHEVLHTKNNLYIVTDLCENGTISDLIKAKKKLSEQEAQKYLSQIIKGYGELAERQIIHRDIKSDNLFLDATNQVMIGDFGLSVEKDSEQATTCYCVGSPYYMAPEVIIRDKDSKICYSPQSDIWAIGITLLQMILGRIPWQSRTQQGLLAEIQNFDIEKALPKHLSSKTKHFLRRSLCFHPEKRMTVKEMLQFDTEYYPKEDITNMEKGLSSMQKQNTCQTKGEDYDPSKPQRFTKIISFKEEPPVKTCKIVKEKATESDQSTINESPKKLKFTASSSGQKDENKISDQFCKIASVEKRIIPKTEKNRLFQETANFKLQQIEEQGSTQDYIRQLQKEQMLLEIPSPQEGITNKKQRKTSMQTSVNQFAQNHKKQRKRSAQVSSEQDFLLFGKKQNSKQSNSSLEEILNGLNGQQKQQEGDKKESNKRIVQEVQEHLNLFRLVFRVFRRINNSLKTSDSGIISFKSHLLYLFEQGLKQAKSLDHLKRFDEFSLTSFKQSSQYSHLMNLLEGYQRRLQKQQDKYSSRRNFKSNSYFEQLMSYVLNVLVENVRVIQKNQEQLNQKKELVFIINDIHILQQLWESRKSETLLKVGKQLNVLKHLEAQPPKQIDSLYWIGIKAQVMSNLKH